MTWSPDGRRIAYVNMFAGGMSTLIVKATIGTGEEQNLPQYHGRPTTGLPMDTLFRLAKVASGGGKSCCFRSPEITNGRAF
jgi:hypothetical protein